MESMPRIGMVPRRIVKSCGASSPAAHEVALGRRRPTLASTATGPGRTRRAPAVRPRSAAAGGDAPRSALRAEPSPRTHARSASRCCAARQAGDVLEGVGAEGDVVGAHDASALVDPEDGRHVDDVVEIGQSMPRVDQRRVRRMRRLDPRAGVVRALVERDRDHGEAPALQLLVQRLPDRQVETAPSPRGPGDEQDLLAAVLAQRVQAPVEVGQREVGRLLSGQRLTALAGGGRPGTPRALPRRAPAADRARGRARRDRSRRRGPARPHRRAGCTSRRCTAGRRESPSPARPSARPDPGARARRPPARGAGRRARRR